MSNERESGKPYVVSIYASSFFYIARTIPGTRFDYILRADGKWHESGWSVSFATRELAEQALAELEKSGGPIVIQSEGIKRTTIDLTTFEDETDVVIGYGDSNEENWRYVVWSKKHAKQLSRDFEWVSHTDERAASFPKRENAEMFLAHYKEWEWYEALKKMQEEEQDAADETLTVSFHGDKQGLCHIKNDYLGSDGKRRWYIENEAGNILGFGNSWWPKTPSSFDSAYEFGSWQLAMKYIEGLETQAAVQQPPQHELQIALMKERSKCLLLQNMKFQSGHGHHLRNTLLLQRMGIKLPFESTTERLFL